MRVWIWLIVPLLVMGSLVTWRVAQKKGEARAQSQQRAQRMKGPAVASLAVARIGEITRTFDATGSVEAPLSVKLAPKITGRIEYLEVHEGDRVRKGQVLVRIDDTEVEAEVRRQMAAVAEAKYRLAQARLTQNPTDVAVGTQVKQQKAAVTSAVADLARAQQSYEAEVQEAQSNVRDAEFKAENCVAAVKSVEANLQNARTRCERVVSLHKKGYMATQDVDDAKAAVTVQECALDIARGQAKSASALVDAARQRLSVVKAKGNADVAAARARLDQTQAGFESAQANTAQSSAFRQSIAALQATVRAAEASLASAKARRRDTVLESPLDGFVTERFSDPGAIASPSQPILSVQFTKALWIAVSVPEEICSKLQVGDKSRVRFDSLPGRSFEAGVAQINPSADPQSRQFTVRLALSNSGGLLKPGMFANVSLDVERTRNLLLVPREAVQRDKMGPVVVALDRKSIARRTPVTLGVEGVDVIAVTGIEPGTRVVTMSSMPIKDGQLVSTGGKPERRAGKPNGARRR